MTHRIATLLTYLMVAAASASVAQPSTQVRRVGIIVSLGDHIEFTHVGWTAFDSRNLELPISSWNLDDQVAQQTAELIRSKFTIVPIIYDKDSFITPNAKWPNPRNPKLEPLIRARPSAESDAYLIIRRTAFPFGDQYFEGLSTATYQNIFLSPNSACATLEIELVKAEDAEIVASSKAPPICTRFNHRDLAESPDKMTEAQLQQLHQVFKTLVSKVLVRSLTAMGLAGSE